MCGGTSLARPTRPSKDTLALCAVLARTPIMSGARHATLRQVSQTAREVDAPRGRFLFRAGEHASGLYVVVSGSVKCVLPRRGLRREAVVALLRDGDILDVSAVILDRPHLVSACTVSRTRLLHVPTEQLLHAIEHDPQVAFRIATVLSGRVRDYLRQLQGVPRVDTAIVKTIKLLTRELPKTARAGPATITLPSSKKAIASKFDISPEHFSRVLRRLTSTDLISVAGKQVTISDVSRLRQYARRESRVT